MQSRNNDCPILFSTLPTLFSTLPILFSTLPVSFSAFRLLSRHSRYLSHRLWFRRDIILFSEKRLTVLPETRASSLHLKLSDTFFDTPDIFSGVSFTFSTLPISVSSSVISISRTDYFIPGITFNIPQNRASSLDLKRWN